MRCIKKFTLSVILFLSLYQLINGQTVITRQGPWQQKTDYTIQVKLDDITHTLSGQEQIDYQNNSDSTLTELYFHIWPNAYKNRNTAFAKQQFENDKTSFYFSEEEDKGYMDSLEFSVNGAPVKWELTQDIDICRLILNTPVKPGETIRITTPFKVKLPRVFSRLGHQGQLYCITQWYPKPAVFDVNGWNPISYLDQGEFYSEFGKFDVSITIPANYVVAATGELQNAEEREWLMKKSEKKFSEDPNCPNSFPESSASYKTLRFVQDNIHDFAWFADKRFQVERSEVILGNGKKVTTWLYEVCPKKPAVHWLDTAVAFYSRLVGDYPYSSATAVVTPLEAGGGMEYPMITNVVNTGRQVIVHEVGHNWFYGILGSNERAYPWMDESFNTYYETRSNLGDKKLPLHEGFWSNIGKGKKFDETELLGGPVDLIDLLYQFSARRNEDQAGDLHSTVYTDFNYGAIIYAKNPKAFFYLQAYLGDQLFDDMMHAYYEKWKFKHPLPDDFFDHAEQYTKKDLSWFKQQVLGSNGKQDFSIKRVKAGEEKTTVSIRNKAAFSAPVALHTLFEDAVTSTSWLVAPAGKDTTVVLPKAAYTTIRIDAYEHSMDLYRNNNSIRSSGIFRKARPFRFKLFGDFENPYQARVFFSPVYGLNLYNKSMLGIAFYNNILPRKKTEYLVVPLYAFGTKDLAGHAEIERHFMTQGWFRNITAGFGATRFASVFFALPTTYEKIYPYLKFDLDKRNKRLSPDQKILLRYVWVNEQTRTSSIGSNTTNADSYLAADYTLTKKRKINPYEAWLHYEIGFTYGNYHKISAEATQFINYNKAGKGFKIRGFAGTFLQKPGSTGSRTFYAGVGNAGYFDYLFDQSQFGRGELPTLSNSVFARQLMPNGTQFSVMDIGFRTTDSWITSLNLSTTVPGIFPIWIYADLAYMNERKVLNVTDISYAPELYYTGGIRLSLFNEILTVNFPLFASTNISDYWEGRNGYNNGERKDYGKRITFMLNLNRLNPIKLARNLTF